MRRRPSDLADSALTYAAHGWRVIPLRPRGKEPLTPRGVKDATTSADTIHRWWRRWPDANIGLAISKGLLVLDIDSPEALHHLRAEDLDLPATARATTGRGLHIWFATGDVAVRNRVSIFPKVDVRAPGGYVVAPPSRHPSGRLYRWEVELRRSAIADCPEWLLERLTAERTPRGRSANGWQRRIATPVPRGRRNQTLAEVAGLLFRRLPAQVAAELAYCWAQVKMDPPLADAEIRRTLDSIATRELRRRRGGA